MKKPPKNPNYDGRYNATIAYLKNAARYATRAADELESCRGYHLYGALHNIELAEKELALCKRHVRRVMENLGRKTNETRSH